MADSSSPGWWKLTFLRRKTSSEPEVLHAIPAEHGRHLGNGPPVAEGEEPQLSVRLERLVEQQEAIRGRHLNVSHSGRFKEKKRLRPTLAHNTQLYHGNAPSNDSLGANAGK